MQISRLSQITFGMPKIASYVRNYLPANLSDEDEQKLRSVESIYPKGLLTVTDAGEPPKGRVSRAVYDLKGALRLRAPRFKIDIHDTIVDPTECGKLGAISVNGAVAKEPGPVEGDVFIYSTHPVRGNSLSVDDLVDATKKFDADFKETVRFLRGVKK